MCTVSTPPSLAPVGFMAAPLALVAYAIPVSSLVLMLLLGRVLHQPSKSVFRRRIIAIWFGIVGCGFLTLQWGYPLLTRTFAWQHAEGMRLQSIGCSISAANQAVVRNEICGYALFFCGLMLPILAVTVRQEHSRPVA